jgi:tetratricopeptide (TPR) repeat protein
MRLHCLYPFILASVAAWGVPRADMIIRNASTPEVAAVDASAHNRAGVKHMNRFLYGEAAGEFRKALEIDPAFNLARINLGIALYYDADFDAARQALEEALARDPANPYANFSLGLVLKHKGLTDEAAVRFRRVVDADPKCASAFYNLGVISARQGKPEEAEAELNRALELDPSNAAALYSLGSFLLKQGRAQEGREVLERFQALPRTTEVTTGMGSGPQYGKAGKYALARDTQSPTPQK